MIAEIKLKVGVVVINLSIPFKRTEIAEAREQFVKLVTSAFDKHVKTAETKWKETQYAAVQEVRKQSTGKSSLRRVPRAADATRGRREG